MVRSNRIPESIRSKIAEKARLEEEKEIQLASFDENNSSLSVEVAEANVINFPDDNTESFQGDDLLYNPNLFEPVKSVGKASVRSGAGAVSVIQTPKNGNRLTISSQVMDALGWPEQIQVQIHGNSIAIASEFTNPSFSYPIRRTGKKGVIYSAALVHEITEALNLEFEKRTTVTLCRYKVSTNDGTTVVVVKQ